MLQNAASDQGLHCLLELREVKGWMKQFQNPIQDHFLQSTLRDNRPTSAVISDKFLYLYM